LFSVFRRLLVFFLGFGWLAAALTSTGTSLIPQECCRVSHSISLDFDFAWPNFAAFTVLEFRGMEESEGLCFSALCYSEK